MHIWAISDLHLSFGSPNKEMKVFGDIWKNHPQKIQKHWEEMIKADDLVLLAGDLSWAKNLEQAMPDLMWLEKLPGTKVMLKGNHDFWFQSLSKTRKVLPPSIHLIQNDTFSHRGITIGGARLWDSEEYEFSPIIKFVDNPNEVKVDPMPEHAEKIFQRELQRLERSLSQLDQGASLRIAMTHFPPIGYDLQPSRASAIMEKYQIDVCIFGHLHSINTDKKLFGKRGQTDYLFTSCDYLNFVPIKIQ